MTMVGQDWLRANWFLIATPTLAAVAFATARSISWTGDSAGFEAALLFDACVTVPLLYALCYGRSLPLWQLVLRAIGLACLGIYLLDLLVPEQAQSLLPVFETARWVGLTILIGFELWLAILLVRLVFGTKVTVQEVQAKSGVPAWVAKLMVLEARFWRGLWRLIRRR